MASLAAVGERQREIGLGLRDLHAASAAAGGRLHQHGKADRFGDRHRVFVGADRAVGAGHHGNAELLGGLLGLDLVAHQADVLGLGADELQIVLGEDLGEARVLREKAVAGMHGFGAGDLAGREQRGDVEIAVLRGRRADADALVREPHMHGVGIGGRMHRDRRDAQFLAGPQDAKRDLAAIGYENLVEHAVLNGRIANGEWRIEVRWTIRYSLFAIRSTR